MDLFWNEICCPSLRLDDQEEEPNGLTETEVQTDGSMEISELDSETVKNCIVVTGSIGKFGHGQSDHYDMAHADNTKDTDFNIEKMGLIELILFAYGQFAKDVFKIFLIPANLFVLTFIMSTRSSLLFVVAIVFAYLFFYYVRPQRFNSTRLIKWTLDEFTQEMKIQEYAFTSPIVHDKSGAWVLAFRQTADEETSFGLIAKHLGADMRNVVANIQILIRIGVLDLIPESDPLKFVHKFECDGDCGFSPRIPINYEQLMGHKLEINCQICFTREELSRGSKDKRARDEVSRRWSEIEHRIQKFIKVFKCPTSKIPENGVILPENKFESKISTGLGSPMLTGTEPEGDFHFFMKYPETKTFVWKIPDFPKRVKNVEFWELSSPQLIVNSNGFCSIWRLQLIELDRVFRLHLQLRGLPRGISQIKIHRSLELVDNFGEYIPLKHCGNTSKNQEFFHLWDTQRVTLYSREAILERFVDSERNLNIRISLHCESNNTVKSFNESEENTDWILHN